MGSRDPRGPLGHPRVRSSFGSLIHDPITYTLLPCLMSTGAVTFWTCVCGTENWVARTKCRNVDCGQGGDGPPECIMPGCSRAAEMGWNTCCRGCEQNTGHGPKCQRIAGPLPVSLARSRGSEFNLGSGPTCQRIATTEPDSSAQNHQKRKSKKSAKAVMAG